jgi:hypothetical protein
MAYPDTSPVITVIGNHIYFDYVVVAQLVEHGAPPSFRAGFREWLLGAADQSDDRIVELESEIETLKQSLDAQEAAKVDVDALTKTTVVEVLEAVIDGLREVQGSARGLGETET